MYIIRILAGVIVTLVGVVLFILPIPFGIVLVLAGAALLSPYIPAIKKMCIRLEARYAPIREWGYRMGCIIRKRLNKWPLVRYIKSLFYPIE